MEIKYFHMYNRLARRQVVNPLACPTCGTEYVLRATLEGDPLLQCFGCNSLVQPGLKMYDRVKAVVSEWYA